MTVSRRRWRTTEGIDGPIDLRFESAHEVVGVVKHHCGGNP